MGAAEAFATWVEPSLVAMNRLAGRLAPSGEADDVVQESLARAWRKRALFDARTRLRDSLGDDGA